MTALWKRQARRAEERRALEELAIDPRGRVKLYCGRCGQEMTSIERHYEQHGGMPQARLVGGHEWTEKSDATV